MPSPSPSLRFKAIDGHMVMDMHAAEAGARRYVGRTLRPVAGADWHDCWPADDSMVYPDLPSMSFALSAVRAGELEAADAWTASRAGVPFSPSSTAPKLAPIAPKDAK